MSFLCYLALLISWPEAAHLFSYTLTNMSKLFIIVHLQCSCNKYLVRLEEMSNFVPGFDVFHNYCA